VADQTLIVIPAFQEAERLGDVLAQIRRTVPDLPLLVIDDGSRDATAHIARAAGVAVVSHPFNLGYGAAIQTGYRYALRGGYRAVIQMDADGQHDPESLARIRARLAEGYDLVLGSRFLEAGSYRPPLARRLGMALFRSCAAVFVAVPISDVTTGYQGLSRRLMASYDREGAFPHDYPDANMLVRAARAGFRLTEVAVRMRSNPTGGSLHVGLKPLLYVFKMLFAIAVEGARPRRRREP